MKKLFAVLFVFIFSVGVFAACSKNQSQPEGSDPAKTSDVSDDPAQTDAPAELTVSDDSEFVYDLDENGVYYIMGYEGNAQIINVPDALEGNEIRRIEEGVFSDKHPVKVRLPKALEKVENWLFSNQAALTDVELNDSVAVIGEKAFINCESLVNVNIPSSLQTIEKGAFCNCKALQNVVLPEGLTSIGETAFGGTGITTVTVPVGVSVLASHVFEYCESLKDVYILNPDVEIATLAFNESPNVVLHAAAGSAVETFAAEHNIPFVAE